MNLSSLSAGRKSKLGSPEYITMWLELAEASVQW